MVVRIEPVLDAADCSVSEEGPKLVEREFAGRSSEGGRVKTICHSDPRLHFVDVLDTKQVMSVVPIVANVHHHVLFELALDVETPLLRIRSVPWERYERRAARPPKRRRVSRNFVFFPRRVRD